MVDMDKMLDKVKKLLALAGNNPSESEAKAALLKANQLIAQYSLDLSNETGDKIEYALVEAVHSNNEGYRSYLGVVLAEAFRCKCVMVSGKVNFFGRKQDAEAGVAVFNYVYRVSHNIGLKLERQARAEGRNTHGVANSYWQGFIAGIQEELSAQCKALMVVVPQDVHDKFTEKFPRIGTYRGGMRNTGFNTETYRQGIEDGRHSLRERKELSAKS